MNRGVVLAWATAMGLITWRGIRQHHKPVPAGQYLAATGVFALLGALGTYEPAAPLAALLAWGFDLGAFMGMYPEFVVPAKTAQKGKQAA